MSAVTEPADERGPRTGDAGAMRLCGEDVLLDVTGALWWPREHTLVVSDLHLEKGASLAARGGAMIPPYDTLATLTTLAEVLARYAPRRVVALGDSFHDENASARLPQFLREQVRSMTAARQWIWIAGNHDPRPPADLGGEFADEVSLHALRFRHEPAAGSVHGEVAGHLHPAARVSVRGRSLRRKCAVCDGSRLILPALGAYTGGLNLTEPAFAGLFDPDSVNAYLLGARCVYRISGRRLGYARRRR